MCTCFNNPISRNLQKYSHICTKLVTFTAAMFITEKNHLNVYQYWNSKIIMANPEKKTRWIINWLHGFQINLKSKYNRYVIDAFWLLKKTKTKPCKYSCFLYARKKGKWYAIVVCIHCYAHKESHTLMCCKVVVSEDWDQGERAKRELIFYIHFCNFHF